MRPRFRHPLFFVACFLLTIAAAPALAWNAHGHRTIARLAMDGLPTEMPSFLKDAEVIARVAEQACEPDRWRGTKRLVIGHELNPEHYLDIEDLEPFGLTLDNLPRLRHEYMRAMILAKDKDPGKFPAYDAKKDLEKSKEWPGFLLHAVDQRFALIQSSFNTLRILEAVDETDPDGKASRAAALQQERENAIHHMGILAHLIGDAAQPLHTTRHHHGWIGENPKGYTTEYSFHSYIDGKIVEHHKLDFESLRPSMEYKRRINPADPWDDVIAYLRRSFDKVEPLYAMHKDGTLTQDAGKEFISERFRDAGDTLCALYAAAWTASKPTDSEISNFIRFNELRTRRRGSDAK
jgi:hypothetical protein